MPDRIAGEARKRDDKKRYPALADGMQRQQVIEDQIEIAGKDRDALPWLGFNSDDNFIYFDIAQQVMERDSGDQQANGDAYPAPSGGGRSKARAALFVPGR